MAKRIMILAGGTGGHVYPALAVAEELRSRGCEVRWMGTHEGLEARVIPAAGIPIDWVSVAGFRGKGWFKKAKAPFKLMVAVAQAARHLWRFRPHVVLGMGGFVAGPGGMVARVMGIPLVIHEQNRIPGTTNRFLIKFAHTVLQAFPHSFPDDVGVESVGNPLRKAILELTGDVEVRKGNRLNVLILGGSQGASVLNEVVPVALRESAERFRVLHQTGEAMRKSTELQYREHAIEADVVAFIHDMKAAYQWADIAICRSGAMTISELAAVGLPAILVPYPFAIDDHQTANAHFLVDHGAAVLLPQSELTSESLNHVLTKLLGDPEQIVRMSLASHSLAQPKATERVCDFTLAAALT